MARRSLLLEWLSKSFRRGLGLGDALAGAAGNGVTIWLHFYPAWQQTVTNVLWEILLSAFVGAVVWRLIATAIEMVRQARDRADAAEARVAELTGGEPIRDRVCVMDAAVFMIAGSWDSTLDDLSDHDQMIGVHDAFKRMEQDAIDDRLTIWVRRTRHGGKHVKLEPKYWEDHHIDWIREHGALSAYPSYGGSLTQTFEPQVRKSDIERLYGKD